jgi:uncharacterized protein
MAGVWIVTGFVDLGQAAMRVTFDPAKNARSVAERSLSFERVADFDWESASALEDDRKDYGERRVRVMALLGPLLHVAVNRGDCT